MNEDILDPKDDTAFRRVLGHFATGIAIVTGETDGKRAGLTCQSFTSVSLDPPLVTWFAGKKSKSWATIRESGNFCVNILSEEQELLSRIFATSGVDKFRDVTTHASPLGSPILDGVIAWVDCRIESVFDAGDHEGVLGRVESIADVTNGSPLLYFRGGYGSFDI